MSLARPIEPGGLFPSDDKEADIGLDELAALDVMRGNHPSFSELHGEEKAPGVALLEDQVNKGFAILFADKTSAEVFLQGKAHPAPLGNISKPQGRWRY